MDILLDDGREGFDLVLDLHSDIMLVKDLRSRIVNTIKLALFTDNDWAGNSLLTGSIGSKMEQMIRQPVSMSQRTILEREIRQALAFMIADGLVSNLDVSLILVDNCRYILRIIVDNEEFTIDNLLEIKE
ncbi:phage GP46 family protein (plasmid) [Entomospira nematocerorum]|uniref:Uncharacterized protein n=1 Tax=Entomospira nematocerorum TaxID=2719987 RepID=A0A968GIN5_9SPIO|nr:phage GP46 family protein [Entomospira nematocera]NIZ47811.1 hypothetical protein [Entomospira nematocera]WDI34744.1 phage GP46 family protein [Entomospira nematocera]